MEISHKYSFHLSDNSFGALPYRVFTPKSPIPITRHFSVLFRYKTTTRDVLTNDYSTYVLTENQDRVTKTVFTQGLRKLSTFNIRILHEAIQTEFQQLFMPERDRAVAIKKVMDKATSMIKYPSKDHNNLVLTVNVYHQHERISYESVPRMVPATDESIEKLERETVEEENYCSICYDEMMTGSVAAKMPCSHAFHGECIQKWLKTSRYCPLCRYQMPTDQ